MLAIMPAMLPDEGSTCIRRRLAESTLPALKSRAALTTTSVSSPTKPAGGVI